MAAKTTTCFTFLKEAIILPTRNPKLFTPVFLLLAVTCFVVPLINVLCIQPLTDDMASHLIKIKNTDPSSAEYARLLEEIKQDARELVLITISLLLVALALSFVKQIVAFFAASTTYSGDRYSFPEILRFVTTGNNLKGPSITIAVVTMVDFACMVLLGVLLSTMMRSHSGVLSVQGFLFLLAFLAFLYFAVVALVSVAASVVDGECRGVRALRQAWRLMTQVRRKEGLVLVLVTLLLLTVVTPLYGVALVYTKKSMALGLCLLFVYALLSGAEQIFFFAAATVYYYQAMESKEVMPFGYAKIPSGVANI